MEVYLELQNKYIEAEKNIRNQEFEKAEAILNNMEEDENMPGRKSFDLGNIAMLQAKQEEALRYYMDALQKGYKKYALFQNIALVHERNENIKEAENMYKMAFDHVQDQKETVVVLNALCRFYYQQDMMLKAEKTAKRIIDTLPESYAGHHLLVLIWQKKQDYERIQDYLAKIREQYENNALYLADCFENFEVQEKYEEELVFLDSLISTMETIPEEIWMQKTRLFWHLDRKNDVKNIIRKLFLEFGNLDAAFSSMLFSITEKNYIEAGKIAKVILQKEEKEPGVMFFWTLYLHIFILYQAFECNPPEEVVDLMKKEAALCRKWFRAVGLASAEFEKSLCVVLGEEAEVSDEG